MYLKFKVMFENSVVADVEMDGGKLLYYKRYDVWCMKMFYLPHLTVTGEMMFDFLQERVVPRTRENINEILADCGLREYNVYELVKITHGTDRNDKIWIKFDGEDLSWEKLRSTWMK